MAGNRGSPVALGGMVAAGQEGHAHLARVVHLRLRDLAGDEGIGARGDGAFEVALRAAGAPGDLADRPGGPVDQRDRAPQLLLHMIGQRPRAGEALAAFAGAEKTQLLLAEAAGRSGMRDQPQAQAELGVVAELGVGVQRQVVGEQIDVVTQEQAQALPHPADHPGVLPAPEQAVVHEDGIGLGMDRRLDQRPAGGHAGDDLAHRGAAFDLQAVGSVVLESLGCEQQVERMQEFVAGGAHHAIVAPRAPNSSGPFRSGTIHVLAQRAAHSHRLFFSSS